MRNRLVSPGFFKNEGLARCSRDARLLFIGLWMLADRNGVLEDRPERIRAEIFPYDSISSDLLLRELAENGDQDGSFIHRYQVEGKGYIWIRKFLDNQHIHPNEAKAVHPLPDITGNDNTFCRSLPQTLPQTQTKRERSDEASPLPAQQGATSESLDELLDWLKWWNGLRDEGLVPAGVDERHPGEAIQRAWKRSQKPPVRGLLANRELVERAIREAAFVRHAGWFRLEKLFGGKNRTGEFILRILLDGGYRDSGREPVFAPSVDLSKLDLTGDP